MSVRYESCTVSVANPNLDGTGTIVDLATGATNGSRIDGIQIKAEGDVTQGMIRFFLWNGATYDLFQEHQVPSTDGDAVTPMYQSRLELIRQYLSNADKIGVSTENAETFNIYINLTDL